MTPSTTRSQAAAKEILSAFGRSDAPQTIDLAADILQRHYADLEAAAVLARDALARSRTAFERLNDEAGLNGCADPLADEEMQSIEAALSALNAALAQDSKRPLERGEAK